MADFTFAHREEGFDEHIDWSIRGYSNLLDDVVTFSRYFVENNTTVVDIGCSTGKVTQQMIEQNYDFAKDVMWEGVEIAEGFQENLCERENKLQTTYPDINVNFEFGDVLGYSFTNCSLVTSIFTLQFMSKKDRKFVINEIYTGLNEGGAFIFAEKIDCISSRIQDMMTFNYYDFKKQNFDYNDIMTKERTLRNMLKPNTWDEIQTMCYDAGFSVVQQFWQNHLFIGAIAIK